MLDVGVRSKHMLHIWFAKDGLLDVEGLLDVGSHKVVIAIPTARACLLWCFGRELR